MYDEYNNCTDEELIDRIRDGEEQITDYIMDKYKNLVRKKAKSMYILGADNDDLIQEGMIGLFKAVRDYDAGRDASFYTFADLCVSRQMYTAVQASRREKHAPLNSYISLYADMTENGQEDTHTADAELVNVLASRRDTNPEELLIDKENVADIESAIEKELSSFEKQVLDLYMTGMSYSEIAKVLGRDEKSTDNALQRLKSKLKRAVRLGCLLFVWAVLFFSVNVKAAEQPGEQETVAQTQENEVQQEEITEVSIEDAEMTIQLPITCYLLGQEIAEDDPYLQKVGGDREKIQDYYREAGIVLNAIAEDDSYEIVVTMNENQAVSYIYNMQSMLDEQIMEFAETIQETYESYGYTVDNSDIYHTADAKYVVLSFGQIYENSTVQCKQYYTIRNNRIYNITLRSYVGEVTEDMASMMQHVIDSITYTSTDVPITYDNEELGVQYTVSEGWKEITPQKAADSHIRAQYMHTNGLGESIQFICKDIWGEMDTLHQLTNTRNEFDATRKLSETEQKKLMPYVKEFFAQEDQVVQKEINGEWYFVSDSPMIINSEKIQGTYQQKSYVMIRNGMVYVWQYGCYEDGNLHEADFENLLAGISYREPKLFMQDADCYQNIANMIHWMIAGIILVSLTLLLVLFLYLKGYQEKEDSIQKP